MDGIGSRSRDPVSDPEKESTETARDFTAREALRTPAFWLLSLGHGCALFVVTGVNTHAIMHMKEGLGYTIEAASFAMMLQTLAQLVGVGLAAWIGDRFDKRILSALCMLGHMGGLLFLTYATGPAMIVAYAILHGTAWGLRGPLLQAIRADFFGRRAIGMILGLSFMIIVDRPDRRPDDRRHPRRHDRQLPRGIHHARPSCGAGVGILPACEAAGAAAAKFGLTRQHIMLRIGR